MQKQIDQNRYDYYTFFYVIIIIQHETQFRLNLRNKKETI